MKWSMRSSEISLIKPAGYWSLIPTHRAIKMTSMVILEEKDDAITVVSK